MTPGALFAVVVWLLASAAFAFYVANVSSYDKAYGALGGLVVFLVWMWLINTALLLGMELNAERERSRELQAGIPGADRGLSRLDVCTRTFAGVPSGWCLDPHDRSLPNGHWSRLLPDLTPRSGHDPI